MKKSVSIVYTIFIIVILLCILGLFAWETYQSRAMRISSFILRSDEYTLELDESMHEYQDVDEELKVAENLMAKDPSIVAIQISSKENGLRLSTVKSAIKEFSQVSITESDHFDKPLTRILYYKITKPMTLNEDFEATFVSTTVTGSEIRNRLMIVLIVVIGMFLITFILILVNPGTKNEIKPRTEYGKGSDFDTPNDSEIETEIETPDSSDYMAPEEDAPGTYTGEGIDDFAPTDRLDENDLRLIKPEYGESVSMKNDVELPALEANETESDEGSGIMNRLDMELEDTAASNQDLSLTVITGDSNIDKLVREHYPDPNLVFSIDSQKTAVIETSKDLDSSISTAKEFLRDCLSKDSNQEIFCGIAARNGRLINADVLYHEAASALLKADRESRIVGFRSDPEKYRDFIRNQSSG